MALDFFGWFRRFDAELLSKFPNVAVLSYADSTLSFEQTFELTGAAVPASTDENKKSATPLEVTLSKLTATDIVALAVMRRKLPSELFQSFVEYLPAV